jgi:hypothetical protein
MHVKQFAALFALCMCALSVFPARMQGQPLLRLETTTTELKTGQYYDVNITLSDAPEIWLTSIDISYNPDSIYVIGTKSGSPVSQGAFFAPESSVVVRNAAVNRTVQYTVSLLAPANQASGSGVIGSFRIYPLKAGKTELRFSRASVSTVTFVQENGQRVGKDPREVKVTPVLLDLNITGDTIPAPAEATATPLPTNTPDVAAVPPQQNATQQPTLENATAAPAGASTPTALSTMAVPETTSGSSSPLGLALVLVLVSGVGIVVLLVVWLRRRR